MIDVQNHGGTFYGFDGESSTMRKENQRVRQVSRGSDVTFLQFRSRGEKHIQGDAIIVTDLEKFNADCVVLHPLDGSETHFDGRFLPRKIQHEHQLLARFKQPIDTEASASTGKIQQGSVVGLLCQ
jgi:hypothetical protein